MNKNGFAGVMEKPAERNSDYKDCAEAVYYDPNLENRAAMRTTDIVSDTWYNGITEYGKLGFAEGTPQATEYKEDDFLETEGECKLSINMKSTWNENVAVLD
jgi:hypothetical protein